MSLVTRMDESYMLWWTHEWVMSHIWRSHVTHMNESCHTYEWVMSHMWRSHVTHVKESRHTYECGRASNNEESRAQEQASTQEGAKHVYVNVCVYMFTYTNRMREVLDLIRSISHICICVTHMWYKCPKVSSQVRLSTKSQSERHRVVYLVTLYCLGSHLRRRRRLSGKNLSKLNENIYIWLQELLYTWCTQWNGSRVAEINEVHHRYEMIYITDMVHHRYEKSTYVDIFF